MIISAEFAERCFRSDKIEIENVILKNSEFGWVVIGAVQPSVSYSFSSTVMCINSAQKCSEVDIQRQLQQFWEFKNVDSVKVPMSNQEICKQLFKETTYRNEAGQFVVQLPKQGILQDLGESLQYAKASLIQIRKACTPEIWLEYQAFMTEYEALGHMSLVPVKRVNDPANYIPHFPVIRPTALTTKVRIVFNGSHVTSTGLSVNDILLNGPTLQAELIDTQIRWRQYSYVLTADIQKMYRNVLIDPADRNYQRIVWQKSINDPIQIYELNTNTYGLSPSSYLATKCLMVLGDELKELNPIAAHSIQNDFYVDDWLTGLFDMNELIERKKIVEKKIDGGEVSAA